MVNNGDPIVGKSHSQAHTNRHTQSHTYNTHTHKHMHTHTLSRTHFTYEMSSFFTGSEFPIRFRPNLLPNQRNEISLVLIGQDGETLLRQIFRFDTGMISWWRLREEVGVVTVMFSTVNFEVECSGTFVEGGDLEIACTTPVGGQTISTLLYSLNGGPTVEGRVDICFGNRVVLNCFFFSISVENPSLPFIIDASALSDSNVVDFTVIGSQGSQLTPSLEFSASSNVTLTLSLYLIICCIIFLFKMYSSMLSKFYQRRPCH